MNSHTFTILQEDTFWMPTDEEYAIYKQISSLSRNRIAASSLQYEERLEENEFTEIYKGYLEDLGADTKEVVAVKMLKPTAPSEKQKALLQEAAILCQFNHKHVVTFFGAKKFGQQVCMTM